LAEKETRDLTVSGKVITFGSRATILFLDTMTFAIDYAINFSEIHFPLESYINNIVPVRIQCACATFAPELLHIETSNKSTLEKEVIDAIT
jgi:hypothetical protein